MVLQDTWLKNGTVKENIAYGKPDATDGEIIAAAKAVGRRNAALIHCKGYIIEQGTHTELLAKNGFYTKLYNSPFAV